MKRIVTVLLVMLMLFCVGCAVDRNDNAAQNTPSASAMPTEETPSDTPSDGLGDAVDDAIDSLETVMPELVPSADAGDYEAENDGEVEDDGSAGNQIKDDVPSASAAPSADSSAKTPEK